MTSNMTYKKIITALAKTGKPLFRHAEGSHKFVYVHNCGNVIIRYLGIQLSIDEAIARQIVKELNELFPVEE